MKGATTIGDRDKARESEREKGKGGREGWDLLFSSSGYTRTCADPDELDRHRDTDKGREISRMYPRIVKRVFSSFLPLLSIWPHPSFTDRLKGNRGCTRCVAEGQAPSASQTMTSTSRFMYIQAHAEHVCGGGHREEGNGWRWRERERERGRKASGMSVPCVFPAVLYHHGGVSCRSHRRLVSTDRVYVTCHRCHRQPKYCSVRAARNLGRDSFLRGSRTRGRIFPDNVRALEDGNDSCMPADAATPRLGDPWTLAPRTSGVTFLEHSVGRSRVNARTTLEKSLRIPSTLINLNHSAIVPILGPRESRLWIGLNRLKLTSGSRRNRPVLNIVLDVRFSCDYSPPSLLW